MRRAYLKYLSIILVLTLCGCAADRFTYKPVTIDADRGRTSAVENPSEKIVPDETMKPLTYEQKAPSRTPAPRKPASVQKLKGVDTEVAINVNNMRLPEFVIYVIGETLKIPFVMDQAMMEDKRLVTLSTPQPLSSDAALELATGVLEKYDLIVEEKAGALHVMQNPPAPRPTLEISSGRESVEGRGDVVHIVPLRYLKAQEIQALIADLSRGGVQIKPYARENVLILHGNRAQIKQMIDFINYFDVPSLQARKIALLRLTYWQPEEFIAQLSKMLESMGVSVSKSGKEPGPVFVAIRQMNAVLAVSPDDASMKYILEWKNKLDTVEAAGADEKAYTFTPQYSRASDIVESLLRLYGVSSRSDGETASKNTGLSGTSGLSSSSFSTTSRASDAAVDATAGKAKSSVSGVSAAALPMLKIAADNNKNIVIMICSPTVYRQHLELLRQLDTQTKQVLIEATIAELSLTDELKYGVEWYLNTTYNGGPLAGGTMGKLGIGSLGMAFSYVTTIENLKAMVNAYATKDKANILSTPRLTVLDNHEAVIQIGQDVPVATGEQTTASSTATDATIVRTIQYRSLGIILKVKPTINSEGMLTLELTQEVSDLSPTTGVGDSPIILMRRINTSVIAAHGQTVALGGLMKEKKGVVERKVPLLGDIPFLGALFKVTERTFEKTELLVLVTPTILTKTDDASRMTDELKKEIKWMNF